MTKQTPMSLENLASLLEILNVDCAKPDAKPLVRVCTEDGKEYIIDGFLVDAKIRSVVLIARELRGHDREICHCECPESFGPICNGECHT